MQYLLHVEMQMKGKMDNWAPFVVKLLVNSEGNIKRTTSKYNKQNKH